jgi:2-polyprenyl-3-methyl-5-hydroxy-6-metoxy-1,4-benzoquinol methylase
MSDVREKWNRIYAAQEVDHTALPAPCEVLRRYDYLLPDAASVLDIACGRGGNALWLAGRGYTTTAVDISDVAIERLTALAQGRELALTAVAAPIAEWLESLDGAARFDVIVISHFLERSLIPVLIERLKPLGLMYQQTFVKEKAVASVGPANPDYLLDPNELLQLCGDLRVRVFYDPGYLADRGSDELVNESYLVAQKMESL